MKLSDKYNRVTFATFIFILLFTGIIYYAVIHFILTDQLDRDLVIEENEISEYLSSYHKLPLAGDFKDQKVAYKLITTPVSRRFENTEYQDDDKESEPGRSLFTSIRVNGQLYQISITKSRVEAEDLVRIIFLITLGITALLLLVLMLINRFILSRLWKPFYNILEQLKAFNITDKNEIIPDNTEIEEFDELNKAAISLSQRVKQDYTELKNFTDNASHEMMTPLAVINSKLDTLLQDEPLSNRQGEIIDEIYTATGRLSRLNQSLLLLNKIENNLIKEQNTVNLKNLIEQKLKQFHELIQVNQITVTNSLQEKELQISQYLADILLNNLVSNAVRHNNKKGKIEIILNDNQLSIINTGVDHSLDMSKIFQRFNKGELSEGSGLGLAISRQICNLYGFDCSYLYMAGRHNFTITFNPSTDFLQL
jgi:signal transduction histidine kinase